MCFETNLGRGEGWYWVTKKIKRNKQINYLQIQNQPYEEVQSEITGEKRVILEQAASKVSLSGFQWEPDCLTWTPHSALLLQPAPEKRRGSIYKKC